MHIHHVSPPDCSEFPGRLTFPLLCKYEATLTFNMLELLCLMSCPGNISESRVKIGWLDILFPMIRLLQQDRTFRHDHLRSLKLTQSIEKSCVHINGTLLSDKWCEQQAGSFLISPVGQFPFYTNIYWNR